jgi:hypothetical protein
MEQQVIDTINPAKPVKRKVGRPRLYAKKRRPVAWAAEWGGVRISTAAAVLKDWSIEQLSALGQAVPGLAVTVEGTRVMTLDPILLAVADWLRGEGKLPPGVLTDAKRKAEFVAELYRLAALLIADLKPGWPDSFKDQVGPEALMLIWRAPFFRRHGNAPPPPPDESSAPSSVRKNGDE